MQKILQPAERAEKTADKAPQQHAQQNQNAGNIIGKPKLSRPDHSLKGPDRAGPRSAGAGVTVQARNAEIFPLALIKRSFEKIRQMDVCQQCCTCLDQSPETGQKMRTILIQCQHTPYIIELLS